MQLKEMGFPESEVRTALRAAFGNAERAADFLMSGSIPPSAIASADAAAARGSAPARAAGSVATGPLAELRSHAQINDMRRLMRRNPEAMAGLMASIGAQSPALLQLITDNQAEFLAILNEPISDGEDAAAPVGGMDEDDDEGDDEDGDEFADEEGMPGGRELGRHRGARGSERRRRHRSPLSPSPLPPQCRRSSWRSCRCSRA